MAKGHENLIPQSERTKEEQREIARKGGIASGKARREKASIKACLKELLAEGDYNGKNGAEAVAASAMFQATHGNVKAMEYVRDTVGEKPVEKVQVAEIDPMIEKEMEGLLNEARRGRRDSND